MWRNSRRWEEASAARGADPSTGHMKILTEDGAGTGRPECRAKYWSHEDERDELSVVPKVIRDEFSKLGIRGRISLNQGQQRDWLS